MRRGCNCGLVLRSGIRRVRPIHCGAAVYRDYLAVDDAIRWSRGGRRRRRGAIRCLLGRDFGRAPIAKTSGDYPIRSHSFKSCFVLLHEAAKHGTGFAKRGSKQILNRKDLCGAHAKRLKQPLSIGNLPRRTLAFRLGNCQTGQDPVGGMDNRSRVDFNFTVRRRDDHKPGQNAISARHKPRRDEKRIAAARD